MRMAPSNKASKANSSATTPSDTPMTDHDAPQNERKVNGYEDDSLMVSNEIRFEFQTCLPYLYNGAILTSLNRDTD